MGEEPATHGLRIDWGDVRPSAALRARVEALPLGPGGGLSVGFARRPRGFSAALRVTGREDDADLWVGGVDLESVVDRCVGLARSLTEPR